QTCALPISERTVDVVRIEAGLLKNAHTFLLGAALCLMAAAPLPGQPATEPRRHTPQERYSLFKKNLELRGEAITANQFREIRNLEDWQQKRPELKRQFLEMLGLDPLPERTPLKARI